MIHRNVCSIRLYNPSVRMRILALVFTCLAVCACGGDKDGGDTGGNGNVPQIRGGERIAWTQQAASLQQLQAMTYRLYVSGAPAALNAVQCANTAGASGYDCSGALPSMSAGLHDLELTSILN